MNNIFSLAYVRVVCGEGPYCQSSEGPAPAPHTGHCSSVSQSESRRARAWTRTPSARRSGARKVSRSQVTEGMIPTLGDLDRRFGTLFRTGEFWLRFLICNLLCCRYSRVRTENRHQRVTGAASLISSKRSTEHKTAWLLEAMVND